MRNNIFTKCLTSIVLLLITNCNTQNIYPKDGDNILNSNLNKFVGTWNWSNGFESLKLSFKKENVKLVPTSTIRADVLYGFHQYIKNDIVVENSTQYFSTNYTDKKNTLLGGSNDNPNKIFGSIRHIIRNKSVRFEIEYIDATHIKLVSLKNYEGLRVNLPGQPPFDSTISLPQNIILTKQ